MVSAEDGVKPQTLEALASIKQANLPFIVAINKIDKAGADIHRTKSSLVENGIYLEGMGGDISWAPVSAKSGEGISDLLDLIILAADLAELSGDTGAGATGIVIEGKLDQKRGNHATLIVKNGTLKSGQFIVSGTALAPVRIMEDFMGKTLKEASLSTPIGIVGFSEIPVAGATFSVVSSKKEAEVLVTTARNGLTKKDQARSELPTIPILIKADALGTIEAIEHELEKFSSDRIAVRVIDAAVGNITANDVQNVSATKEAIIVGFNVTVDRPAQDIAERLGVEIDTFSIIYELSEWLNEALKNRTPQQEDDVISGRVKILKHFSAQKNVHVLGGRMEEGVIKLKQRVHILRRDVEIGKGVIKNLQQLKSDVQKVEEGEFGLQLETKTEIAPGDHIVPYDTVIS